LSLGRSRAIRVFKRAVDKAHSILNTRITVYYSFGTRVACEDCVWDPIGRQSLNPNCPSCNGNFYQLEILSKVIPATVAWVGLGNKYIPMSFPAGQLDINDVYISCKLKDVLVDPSSTAGKTIFHYATKIDIGGDIVKPLTTPVKSGLAGEFYTCALVARREANPYNA